MKTLMLINARERIETRIALLQDGRLEQYYAERTGKPTLVGNIYLATVIDVRGALQAAFVDVGLPRRAFLHVTETMNPRGYRGPRRIERLVRPGETLLVQVIRDEFGEKGASVTTDLAIPGRFLVLKPLGSGAAVARRIAGSRSLDMVKKMIRERIRNERGGVILRTASGTAPPGDVMNDLDYLLRVWQTVERRGRSERPPALLYEETDFVLRCLRENFHDAVSEVVVDDELTFRRVVDFFNFVMPRFKDRVRQYSEAVPLFHKYGVEAQVHALSQPIVPLASGGNIVIERTEGLTAIDVNSERFTKGRNPEEIGLKTNLEAVLEIQRQIRLRDIGGIIVVDFISLKRPENIRRVEQAMREEAKKDRKTLTVLPMSELGIMEMAREKTRPSVEVLSQQVCPACEGTGRLRDPESLGLELSRLVRAYGEDPEVRAIEIQAPDGVVDWLEKRAQEFRDFERRTGKRVQWFRSSTLPPGRAEFAAFNEAGDRIADRIH